jgi:hypothetical protein
VIEKYSEESFKPFFKDKTAIESTILLTYGVQISRYLQSTIFSERNQTGDKA